MLLCLFLCEKYQEKNLFLYKPYREYIKKMRISDIIGQKNITLMLFLVQ
jgi:hypothetical protein